MKKQLAGFFILLAIMVWFACGQNQSANQPDDTTQQQSESTPPADSTQQQPPAQEPQAPQQNPPAASAGFRMPAFWENPDAAPKLAPTLDPAIVSPEARAAYVVAQKKPKLLAQMPCFCYCDRFGHQSLHDCYVTTHAEHCDVCIAEAVEADQLEQQGMSPEEIRSVLVAKHHPPSE